MDGVDVYFLSEYLQKNLQEHLKKIGKEDKAAEYYSILSSSDKKSEVQTEEIARLKLIEEIENSAPALTEDIKNKDAKDIINQLADYPELLEKIKKHTKKFEWLPYAYIGPKLDIEGTIKLLKSSLTQKNLLANSFQILKKTSPTFLNVKKKSLKK